MDIYKSFSVYLCYCICVMYRFMAPEVLLCSVAPTHTVYTNGSAGSYKNNSSSKVGYTNAVDYWSLGNTHVHHSAPTLDPSLSLVTVGVTIYKLINGRMPFHHPLALTEHRMEDAEARRLYWCDCGEVSVNQLEAALPREYADLIAVLRDTDGVTDFTIDIIVKLLGIPEAYRLGAGRTGIRNLKSHMFFRGVEWNLLEQRISTPPYIPPVLVRPGDATSGSSLGSGDSHGSGSGREAYSSFQHMVREVNKGQGLDCTVRSDEQRHFDTW